MNRTRSANRNFNVHWCRLQRGSVRPLLNKRSTLYKWSHCANDTHPSYCISAAIGPQGLPQVYVSHQHRLCWRLQTVQDRKNRKKHLPPAGVTFRCIMKTHTPFFAPAYCLAPSSSFPPLASRVLVLFASQMAFNGQPADVLSRVFVVIRQHVPHVSFPDMDGSYRLPRRAA
jgi:hypothetical protein